MNFRTLSAPVVAAAQIAIGRTTAQAQIKRLGTHNKAAVQGLWTEAMLLCGDG